MAEPALPCQILEMPNGCVFFTSWGKSTAEHCFAFKQMYLAEGKIAPLVLLTETMKIAQFYMGGSGLDRTDDFQKFCRSGLDRIQFYWIRTGFWLKNSTAHSSLLYSGYASNTTHDVSKLFTRQGEHPGCYSLTPLAFFFSLFIYLTSGVLEQPAVMLEQTSKNNSPVLGDYPLHEKTIQIKAVLCINC